MNAQENISPEILFNRNERGHLDQIKQMLRSAIDFTCLVAFAKRSGFKYLEKAIESRLKKGMTATFVVGLDFFQSDTEVLKSILAWSNRYDVTFYVNDPSSRNFHPKIYLFRYVDGSCQAIFGSANLTSGGFMTNCEASIIVISGTLKNYAGKVDAELQDLLAAKDIVVPDRPLIDDYERRRDIFKAEQALAATRAKRTADVPAFKFETLAQILSVMKSDKSEQGFVACQRSRAYTRRQSKTVLKQIADKTRLTERTFSELYEPLVAELWHSSGLQRGKNIIARQAAAFQRGVNRLLEEKPTDPEEAYALLLVDFEHLSRAGVNVISEILHAVDNQHFAVMNKNSVHGMRLANFRQFPRRPNKNTVRPGRYGEFCAIAQQLRKELGLANLTELDALFNYAYSDREADETDDNDDE